LAGIAATSTVVSGFPWIANSRAAEPIKLGVPTIMSGRVAQLGISCSNAIQMVLDAFNEAGGLDGRPVEMLIRDSKAKPDEAARVTRDFVNSDQVDVVFNCEASSASFAVQEVVRESGTLCLHNVSETSSLSADPAIRSANSFRFARQGIHDAVGSAGYAARIAGEKGLTKWMSVSPDYAYGRDNTELFFKLLKLYGGSDIDVVGGGWPKLFQPDYTEVITQILQKRPDAIYSALWGGDLVSFIDQATLYGVFEEIEFFTINLADHTTMSAVNDLPNDMHSGTRYLGSFPDTERNRAFDAAYMARFGDHPTNWSWECKVSAEFLLAAMTEAGSADGAKTAEVLRGMTRPAIVGVGEGGTATMRAEDQTLINYAIGWGTTVAEEPFVTGIQTADWAEVLAQETAWKKEQGYI
jgi:branched-chain amino acid transport system substrate-binding protein